MTGTLVNQANTTVAPVGGGRWRVTKTGGSDGNYDAAARSVAAFAGDVMLRATLPSSVDAAIVALAIDPAPTVGFGHLDHAAHLAGTVFGLYELGDFLPPVQPYTAPVWIARIGGTVSYRTGEDFDDATVLRAVTGVTAPLFFDCALSNLGASFDVRFGSPAGWLRGRRARRALSFGASLALS